MPGPFLTARWANLCLLSYAVPPSLLEPRLPPGLELDERDGKTYASLVAFDFLDTRVLGIPWPGYRSFPELNLRFYVRQGAERGVVFVREFVPKRLVAWLARAVYNEPYVAAPLSSTLHENDGGLTFEQRITFGGRTHTISVTGSKPAVLPCETSMDHFFKEHRWGFGINRRGECIRYEVQHPHWDVYGVQSYHLDLDWEMLYGPEWQFLCQQTPCSVIFAVGSAVAVYPKGKLAIVPTPQVALAPGTT
jgi:uncharacterized protein